MTDTDAPTPGELDELVDELAQLARASSGQPTPIMAGTFALYAAPDGGVVLAADVTHGPVTGVQHRRIPPSLIRAMTALSGGGPLARLKALTRRSGDGQ